jgi:phosphoglycolate phosphatase-like HAD superfamily hydrolase
LKDNPNTLIIFDLDGTLFNTTTAFIPACKEFFYQYHSNYPGDDEVMKLVGEPESYFKTWLKRHHIHEDFSLVRQSMIELEVKYILDRGRLFDGVDRILNYLHQHQFEMALCSNAVPDYQQAVFLKTGMGNYVKKVRLPLSSSDTKSIMLSELLKHAASAPFHIMIGDRIHDIQAAKDNGILSIGCAYGYGGNEIKEADYIVQSASEILEIIRQL